MKTKLTVLLALAALALSGCASRYSLPEIAGKSVEYRRFDPFGGTVITAKGVEVTATEVTADEAVWDTKYPTWGVYLKVEGYKRARK